MARALGGGRNFLITTGLGAVTVGTIALATDDGSCTEGIGGCAGAGGSFALGAIAGAIVSAPIGLIVGLAVRSEHWERATLGPPLGASLTLRPIRRAQVMVGIRLPLGPTR
jgi:hypothetical protein